MPRLFLVIVLLFAILAVDCGGNNNSASSGANVSAGTIATAPATAPATSASAKPTEPPTPASDQISVANEAISVQAADGVVLRSHLYSPNGPKRQALIIVAPVDQSIWAKSTQAFTSKGIAVFTFDPRGFGETGGTAMPDKLASDLQLITLFVNSREYPLIYVLAAGPDASQAAVKDTPQAKDLSGLITYGFPGDAGTNSLSLAPSATWSGENILENTDVQTKVLQYVLGTN